MLKQSTHLTIWMAGIFLAATLLDLFGLTDIFKFTTDAGIGLMAGAAAAFIWSQLGLGFVLRGKADESEVSELRKEVDAMKVALAHCEARHDKQQEQFIGALLSIGAKDAEIEKWRGAHAAVSMERDTLERQLAAKRDENETLKNLIKK